MISALIPLQWLRVVLGAVKLNPVFTIVWKSNTSAVPSWLLHTHLKQNKLTISGLDKTQRCSIYIDVNQRHWNKVTFSICTWKITQTIIKLSELELQQIHYFHYQLMCKWFSQWNYFVKKMYKIKIKTQGDIFRIFWPTNHLNDIQLTVIKDEEKQ